MFGFFVALFNSSVGWALSLFYKFNCWTNRYFEEGKKKFNCVSNIPKNIIDDEFPGGCYLCDECGWFLSGAYDSNYSKVFN